MTADSTNSELERLRARVAELELKRTSELVATERLASLILEQVTEPIVVCDRDGRVIRASLPVHRLCGSSPLLQCFAEVFPLRDAAGRSAGIDVVDEALAGHAISGVEAVLDRDDGPLSLLLSAGPLIDGQGAVIGCVVAMTDVTAQRRADIERERLLEAAERARRQAEAASRAKDEFMAILGHELRNPLAPISTALQVMQLRGSSVGEREREVIERQVAHLVRLVDDLLDLSRITRGKLGLKKRRIHLPDAIGKAIEMASPLLEERHHTMEVQMTPGLWVLGDPHRLAQVFSNLLCNAAKYTEPRGRITVRAQLFDGAVVIAVQDNGIGIRPELLPQVFDLFVQGQRRVERAQGGLGLGLSLVKSLVTMHGGRVEAHSDGPGRGSRFEVRLPLARPLEAHPPAEPRLEQRPSSRLVRRVLVVDDNPDAADLLAEALEAFGYEVAVSHDGPGALLAARDFRPEVGILDIGLPVMDGYELGRRLREEVPEICLIALTGYGQEADRRRSHDAGFAAHLVKPVELGALVGSIERGPRPRAARPSSRPPAAARADEPTSS
jgi:signal transduction histidine kinase/CheY-like chemotaxis protein